MRTYRYSVLLSLLSLFVLVAGCGNPFPPRTLVERLRVLGIRAEPADADLQSTVTLSALVVNQYGNVQNPSATWAICSPNTSYATFATDCPSDTSFSLPSGEPLANGEPTALIVGPDLVAQILERGYTINVSTTQVVDIFIGLVVSANGEEVHALKRLPVHIFPETSPPAESTYNHNPKLERVDDVKGKHTITGDSIELSPDGDAIKLKPVLDIVDSEREIFTPSGETTPREEDFVFTWFSTVGEFDNARTVSAADNQNAKLDENVWAIPTNLTDQQKSNSFFMWVVVRDGRFGEDWIRLTGNFVSTP